jgi:hypothetical protein
MGTIDAVDGAVLYSSSSTFSSSLIARSLDEHVSDRE